MVRFLAHIIHDYVSTVFSDSRKVSESMAEEFTKLKEGRKKKIEGKHPVFSYTCQQQNMCVCVCITRDASARSLCAALSVI